MSVLDDLGLVRISEWREKPQVRYVHRCSIAGCDVIHDENVVVIDGWTHVMV